MVRSILRFITVVLFLISSAAMAGVTVNNNVLDGLGLSPDTYNAVEAGSYQTYTSGDFSNASPECQAALKMLGGPLNPNNSVPVVCLNEIEKRSPLSAKQQRLLEDISNSAAGLQNYRDNTDRKIKFYEDTLPDQLGGTTVINSKTVRAQQKRKQEIADKLKSEKAARAKAEAEAAALKAELDRMKQQTAAEEAAAAAAKAAANAAGTASTAGSQAPSALDAFENFNTPEVSVRPQNTSPAPKNNYINEDGELVLSKPRVLVPDETVPTTTAEPDVKSMDLSFIKSNEDKQATTPQAPSPKKPADLAAPMTIEEFNKLPKVGNAAPKITESKPAKPLFDEELAAPVKPVEQASLTPQDVIRPLDKEVIASLAFAPNSEDLSSSAKSQLQSIAAKMAADANKRVQIIAYAAGAKDVKNKSAARRLSLSRAIAVRTALTSAGVAPVQIDIRAMGDTGAGTEPDRVDVLNVQ